MNTGIIEELKNELRICIDWIGFTVFKEMSVNDLIDILGYDEEDFTQLPKGGMGYKSILQLNGYTLQILYDGKPDMGIHVNISGSSISEVVRSYMQTKKVNTPFGEGYDTFHSGLVALLKEIDSIGRVTRIDIAVDDLGMKYYSLDELAELLNGKNKTCKVVSKFRSFQEICKRKLTGEKTGQTLYMGSRQSEIFMRVYDKRLEQKNKCSEDLGVEWIRWELEFKDSRAMQVMDLIIQREELSSVFVGVLNNYMRIVNLDNSNTSRCSVTEKWQRFIGTLERIRLYVSDAEKTLVEKIEWFKSQVAPTLAGIIVSSQGDMGIIYDFFDDYLSRMSKDMRTICDRYNPSWRADWGVDNECVA